MMSGFFAEKLRNVKSLWTQQLDDEYYEDDVLDSEQEYDEVDVDLSHMNIRSRRELNDNVVSINATARLNVAIVKPKEFQEVNDVAEHLRAKNLICLNLEETRTDVARRILDFISGAAYICDGEITKVADKIFVITPSAVGIIEDNILEDLERSGHFF